MRTQTLLSRLTSTVAITALLGATILPPTAWAQTAPPPAQAPGTAPQTQADPPARVGRLAQVTGTVSFHNPSDTEWSPATLNYPVVSGNSFWTQPAAQAELEFGDSQITMNASTEFDLGTLDPTGVTATIPQGEIYAHVRSLAQNEALTLQTPRGTVTITAPGDYGVVAGDTANPTVVTVFNGAAQVSGTGVQLNIAPGQAATITGADSFQGSVGPAPQDAFLAAMLAQNQPAQAPAQAAQPPAAVLAMTGGDDLTTTGTWQTAPDYGQVWYPPVAAGWVPYREGHWAFIPPWGWTWVDDDSWGFAPFHYGRWAYIGDRWGWLPGVEVGAGFGFPVYAPALVAFFGVGVGVGFAIGGSIGWAPLGPGEAYHPWYHASDRYLGAVNPHIANYRTVNNVTINNYHNGRFATVVPAATLTNSRPVRGAAVPVSSAQLAAAHPTFGRDPVRPTAATAGVTPAVARQLHVAATPGVAARPAAPGPAVRPITPASAGRPAAVPLRPATGAARPAAARPTSPVGAVAPAARSVGPARPAEAPHPGLPHAGAGAPGPAIEPHAAGAPELRPASPAERPEVGRPGAPAGGVTPGVRPAITQPGERPAAVPHSAEAPRAAEAPRTVAHPGAPAARPEATRPAAEAPHPVAAARPAAVPHPAAAPRPAARPAAAPHPAPRPAPHPAPHPAPRPAPHPAPHPTPHPAPHPAPAKKPGEK